MNYFKYHFKHLENVIVGRVATHRFHVEELFLGCLKVRLENQLTNIETRLNSFIVGRIESTTHNKNGFVLVLQQYLPVHLFLVLFFSQFPEIQCQVRFEFCSALLFFTSSNLLAINNSISKFKDGKYDGHLIIISYLYQLKVENLVFQRICCI